MYVLSVLRVSGIHLHDCPEMLHLITNPAREQSLCYPSFFTTSFKLKEEQIIWNTAVF